MHWLLTRKVIGVYIQFEGDERLILDVLLIEIYIKIQSIQNDQQAIIEEKVGKKNYRYIQTNSYQQ